MRNFIPGPEIYHTGLREAEDGLEFPDRVGCGRAVEAVCGDAGNGRVDSGNGIQLFLQLLYLLAGGTDGQILSGPGGRNSGNQISSVDIDAGAVKMAEDFNGTVAEKEVLR